MTTFIKNISLFDGLHEQFEENAYLGFDPRTGKITELGTGQFVCDATDSVVDGKNQYLLPGLINAHTHIMWDPNANKLEYLSESEVTVNALHNLKLLLNAGVTYIRDCGSAFGIDVKLARLIQQGQISGPDIIASGRPMSMTGGHGDLIEGAHGEVVWGHLVDSKDAMRQAVREEFKHGVKNIKVMATGGVMSATDEIDDIELSESELSVAVAEAHTKHMTVAAHAQGNQGITNALRAGVDSIEHGIYLDERQAQYMKDHHIFLVPTLNAPTCIAEQGVGILPDYMLRKNDQVKDDFFQNMRMAFKLGVPIVVGTDAGTSFNQFDTGTAKEMALLVSVGATNAQALQAATRYAAELLRIDEAYGTLEVGKNADLLLLDQNPLEDITAMEYAQKRVYKNGHLV
ncbi:amidohydrolase family protein [Bombilactobacillus folatiphilus]|uniref:Amidohydrolase family protein n=1 Tax=Bombilactobacillus folatiphilus TaxID=2923362 RepID=A0ABY4PB18_9LACO|nr:amidohydrolase family protein [Bombilactobacillus folatiphilus]UQS82800.1 amidohydrolase family protein [Bombilactobacillus folatiphilus]